MQEGKHKLDLPAIASSERVDSGLVAAELRRHQDGVALDPQQRVPSGRYVQTQRPGHTFWVEPVSPSQPDSKLRSWSSQGRTDSVTQGVTKDVHLLRSRDRPQEVLLDLGVVLLSNG